MRALLTSFLLIILVFPNLLNAQKSLDDELYDYSFLKDSTYYSFKKQGKYLQVEKNTVLVIQLNTQSAVETFSKVYYSGGSLQVSLFRNGETRVFKPPYPPIEMGFFEEAPGFFRSLFSNPPDRKYALPALRPGDQLTYHVSGGFSEPLPAKGWDNKLYYAQMLHGVPVEKQSVVINYSADFVPGYVAGEKISSIIARKEGDGSITMEFTQNYERGLPDEVWAPSADPDYVLKFTALSKGEIPDFQNPGRHLNTWNESDFTSYMGDLQKANKCTKCIQKLMTDQFGYQPESSNENNLQSHLLYAVTYLRNKFIHNPGTKQYIFRKNCSESFLDGDFAAYNFQTIQLLLRVLKKNKTSAEVLFFASRGNKLKNFVLGSEDLLVGIRPSSKPERIFFPLGKREIPTDAPFDLAHQEYYLFKDGKGEMKNDQVPGNFNGNFVNLELEINLTEKLDSATVSYNLQSSGYPKTYHQRIFLPKLLHGAYSSTDYKLKDTQLKQRDHVRRIQKRHSDREYEKNFSQIVEWYASEQFGPLLVKSSEIVSEGAEISRTEDNNSELFHLQAELDFAPQSYSAPKGKWIQIGQYANSYFLPRESRYSRKNPVYIPIDQEYETKIHLHIPEGKKLKSDLPEDVKVSTEAGQVTIESVQEGNIIHFTIKEKFNYLNGPKESFEEVKPLLQARWDFLKLYILVG